MISPSNLALALAVATAMATGAANAHTRFDVTTLQEGVRATNNIAISHSCSATSRTIGTSVVFPDGTDSIITTSGLPFSGTLASILTNWGPNIQPLFTTSPFTDVDEKNGPTGNVVGFWAGGGPGMPNHMLAMVPFRFNATNFVPESCVTSVRFFVSIADICEITTADKMHEDGKVEFWTHNNLGTIFDRVSPTDNGPATLTLTRNLTTNPLPAACGTGISVDVKPSAAQINRDMPIKYNGVQVWPAP